MQDLAPTVVKPSIPVKLAYSLGQVGQNGGFDAAVAFIFFYYSAVLGLSGTLVGAALAVGLAADACVDPVIGSWSDNMKSRHGRRLPLMALSVPLIAISLGLLFSPPDGLGQIALFGWLAVMSVAVRSSISLFKAIIPLTYVEHRRYIMAYEHENTEHRAVFQAIPYG